MQSALFENRWWCPSLDNSGNGTSTLNELVAGTDNASITGASWVSDTGAGGVRALQFAAASNHFAIASSYAAIGSEDRTLSCWFKPTGALANFSGVTGQGNSNATSTFGFHFQADGSLNAYAGSNSGNNLSIAALVSLDAWHHVVWMRKYHASQAVALLWVNGVYRGRATSVATSILSTGWNFGRNGNSATG